MNTNLLTLIGAIFIYYALAPDIQLENERLVEQIRLIDYKITAENSQNNQTDEVDSLLKIDRIIHQENINRFIPHDVPTALAMADIQNMIQKDVNATSVELNNFSWGEPMKRDESFYTLLPMSLSFKGNAKEVAKFLQKLYAHDHMMRIENISIVPVQTRLSVVADLYAYRIEQKDTNEAN